MWISPLHCYGFDNGAFWKMMYSPIFWNLPSPFIGKLLMKMGWGLVMPYLLSYEQGTLLLKIWLRGSVGGRTSKISLKYNEKGGFDLRNRLPSKQLGDRPDIFSRLKCAIVRLKYTPWRHQYTVNFTVENPLCMDHGACSWPTIVCISHRSVFSKYCKSPRNRDRSRLLGESQYLFLFSKKIIISI